jgi:hypothetical protein
MPTTSLKERVERLETEVAQLKTALNTAKSLRTKNWRRAVDKFTGDADLLGVFAEARKLREADRSKARRKHRASKP